MLTKNGVIKRTALSAYKNTRSTGIIAINLDEGDELAFVKITNGDEQLLIATKKGKSIRIDERDAREMGRTAHGVRAVKLKGDDCVVAMTGIDDESVILTVTETGYGRKSTAEDYRLQTRGGQGVTNYNTQKYGDVCTVLNVTNDDDIIMIASNGIIIRIAVAEISTFSRPAKGVRVMRVAQGEKILSIVATEHSDDEETAEVEAPEADAGEGAETTQE